MFDHGLLDTVLMYHNLVGRLFTGLAPEPKEEPERPVLLGIVSSTSRSAIMAGLFLARP